MKNLELNNCDKNHLDEDISRLQHLQKQYYQYEKEITYSDEMLNRVNCCLSSDDGDISSEDILKCLHSDINSISSDGRENVNTITHGIQYQSSSPIHRSQSNNNCMYDRYFFTTLIVIHFRFLYQMPIDNSEFLISVPSYVIRGAGKHTHFEYEVRITLADDKWTLMRRYSRFRELHISLKSFYGDKVYK